MAQYQTGQAKILSAAAPASAPTATDSGVAGNVNVGAHSWKVTFVHTAGGETIPSAKSNVVTIATTAKRVDLSAIPLGPAGTASRKIYRTVAGDTGDWKLAVTIANNTATTVSDDVADASLGVAAPTTNTFPTATVVLSGGTTTGNIAQGNLWKFKGEVGFYEVASITDSTTAQLTATYTGTKALDTLLEYLVTKDFTGALKLPELTAGDVDTADVYTRAMRTIDTKTLTRARSAAFGVL